MKKIIYLILILLFSGVYFYLDSYLVSNFIILDFRMKSLLTIIILLLIGGLMFKFISSLNRNEMKIISVIFIGINVFFAIFNQTKFFIFYSEYFELFYILALIAGLICGKLTNGIRRKYE